MSNEDLITSFWNQEIDWEDLDLETDQAPFCMMENTQMAKIHYIFTMLNINSVHVISRGKMTGLLTKQEFIEVNKRIDAPIKS